MDEKTLTTAEKRAIKIAQLKAQLQKEEARQSKDQRKQRDGELIAWGVYIETLLKTSDKEKQQKIENSIKETLSGRNLERALNGIKRVTGITLDNS